MNNGSREQETLYITLSEARRLWHLYRASGDELPHFHELDAHEEYLTSVCSPMYRVVVLQDERTEQNTRPFLIEDFLSQRTRAPVIGIDQNASMFSHTLTIPLLAPEDPRYGSVARGLTVDGAWELIHYNNYDIDPAKGVVTFRNTGGYKKVVFDFETRR